MSTINRRLFLKQFAAASFGIAVRAQSKPKSVEDIIVDPVAFNDIATTIYVSKFGSVPYAVTASLQQSLFDNVTVFNRDLISRGYTKKDVKVGRFYTANQAQSFRIGNAGAITLADKTIANGKDEIRLQEAHEYSHLYHKTNVNGLLLIHPALSQDKTPAILALQQKYATLLNQIDIPYEAEMNAKRQQKDNYHYEYDAEKMAVRLTCLQNLSLKISNDAMAVLNSSVSIKSASTHIEMTPAERKDLLNGVRGQIDGARGALPFICGI